jgi:tol-pal system protein YbgF
MRNFARLSLVLVCVAGLAVPNAFATSTKDYVISIQAQVQQLQQMMMAMQRSNDERYALMHNLLQQTSQSVLKLSGDMDIMKKAVEGQQGSQGNALQQLSAQMQSMNDSLDALRARLTKMDKTLSDMQSQQQVLAPGQTGMPITPGAGMEPNGNGGQGAAPSGNGQSGNGLPPENGNSQTPDQDAGAQPGKPSPDQTQTLAAQAPPLDQLYQSAVSDYNSAKYNLSSQEFGDVIKYYPQSSQAGNAQFYLGEMDYRAGNYKGAIDNYNQVLTQYPGSAKAATAQLRKGEAELAIGQRNAGIEDLRNVIYRHPQSPEAMRARSKLNGMGVRIYPKKPSAAQ